MRSVKTKLLSTLFGLQFLIVCFTPLSVTAANSCDPCGWLNDVSVGVDFLYWQPCINDLHYASKGDSPNNASTNNFDHKYVDPHWDTGVRAFIEKRGICGCFDFKFTYTYFDAYASSKTTSDVGNNSISLTNGTFFGDTQFDSATSHWKLEYQSFEGTIGYCIPHNFNQCLDLSAYTGLQGVLLCEYQRDDARRIVTPVTHREINRYFDYWGVGPTLGLDYTYRLCGPWSAFGALSSSLVIGDSDRKNTADDQVGDIETKSHDHCVCFPGWHWQSGISYQTCFCEKEVNFKIGYEYLQWINVPTFFNYDEDERGTVSSTKSENITFHGLFAGVDLSF